MATSTISALSTVGIGGTVQEYLWTWEGQELPIVYETLGKGSPILLLPAFSTVSTRAEMRGLAELLSSQFQAVALDWPGFGRSSRLPLNYQPALYHQFLQDFVKNVFDTPIAIIAAGHAAGYAMQLAQQQPPVLSRIVLAAPTWRGPFPTMMGKKQGWFGTLRNVVRSPILGQALYKLNTTESFISLMYRRHVYVEPDSLTPSRLEQKLQTAHQPGARFAPAAFITGGLDPVNHRDDFLAWFQPLPLPVMVVIGEQAPPKSKAEMEAMANVPGVQTLRLPGSLGLHEEYADAVGAAILPFLMSGGG
ncbi:alpha/beta hydrolase [Coleofasciculus sp. FACHB-501]|uniref:alpha/beta fold hydrolase n=1 Tax=Cyanophyceae TaxID=3028117 RepID=UPI00168965C6|nr:alpha/beta hydrolase [Coleofasciculus sp. FACHB-501]MBD1837735.1 alpha/beta hydrolase [Coleofasciculus sp. FACHB-501]